MHNTVNVLVSLKYKVKIWLKQYALYYVTFITIKKNFFKGPLQMNVKEHTIGKWTKNTNKRFKDIQMIVVQSH